MAIGVVLAETETRINLTKKYVTLLKFSKMQVEAVIFTVLNGLKIKYYAFCMFVSSKNIFTSYDMIYAM